MQHVKDKNLVLLGQRIKKLRLEKSLSLNKFVFALGGVTSATWSRIENGLVNVKFTTLLKVASMLDTTVSKLVEGINFDYSLDE